MIDEKMAEEWVSSAEYQRDRPIEPFSTDECSNDWAELAKYAESMLPKAFLAGLKANRPQWHDLRKNPNDLPKENKRYLCKIEGFVGGNISYECFDYDTEYNSWKEACGDVIAWQEIILLEGIDK